MTRGLRARGQALGRGREGPGVGCRRVPTPLNVQAQLGGNVSHHLHNTCLL